MVIMRYEHNYISHGEAWFDKIISQLQDTSNMLPCNIHFHAIL